MGLSRKEGSGWSSRKPIGTASLCDGGRARRLVWLGQMGTGRDLGAKARPCGALEATVKILAFTLNDAGSPGRVLSRKITYCI